MMENLNYKVPLINCFAVDSSMKAKFRRKRVITNTPKYLGVYCFFLNSALYCCKSEPLS